MSLINFNDINYWKLVIVFSFIFLNGFMRVDDDNDDMVMMKIK